MHRTLACGPTQCGTLSLVPGHFRRFCLSSSFSLGKVFLLVLVQRAEQGTNGSIKHRGVLTKGMVISPWLLSTHPPLCEVFSVTGIQKDCDSLNQQLICTTVMRPVSRPPQTSPLCCLLPSSVTGPLVTWPVWMKLPGTKSPRNPWGPCGSTVTV